jgi:hypothetical protein
MSRTSVSQTALSSKGKHINKEALAGNGFLAGRA